MDSRGRNLIGHLAVANHLVVQADHHFRESVIEAMHKLQKALLAIELLAKGDNGADPIVAGQFQGAGKVIATKAGIKGTLTIPIE